MATLLYCNTGDTAYMSSPLDKQRSCCFCLDSSMLMARHRDSAHFVACSRNGIVHLVGYARHNSTRMRDGLETSLQLVRKTCTDSSADLSPVMAAIPSTDAFASCAALGARRAHCSVDFNNQAYYPEARLAWIHDLTAEHVSSALLAMNTVSQERRSKRGVSDCL